MAVNRSDVFDPNRPDNALDVSKKETSAFGEAVDDPFGGSAHSGAASASARSSKNPLSRPQSGMSGGSKGGAGKTAAAAMLAGSRSGSMQSAGFARSANNGTRANAMLEGDGGVEVVIGGGGGDAGSMGSYDPYAEGGDGGGFATADRMEAEQIFMPNMKREAYVPVRIARDKVKMVLSEMAQLKSMHYQALETMEKQHEILKAQLEATVAAYVRKLTKDYNDRVVALESEYKRRLGNINTDAVAGMRSTVEQTQKEAATLEERADQKIAEKTQEFAAERKLFVVKAEESKKQLQAAQEESTALKADLAAKQKEIDSLKARLIAKGDGESVESLNQKLFEANDKIADLERENAELKEQLAEAHDDS